MADFQSLGRYGRHFVPMHEKLEMIALFIALFIAHFEAGIDAWGNEVSPRLSDE